ncbi:MAG: hypothetical protein HFG49_10105 [Lachnospiraceae bacterium]|jgi:hypothetical protein|nr:hypothetical protein [Lachnospiraceae bacterium]
MKGVFRNCLLGVVLLVVVSAVSIYMGQMDDAEGVSSGKGILIQGIRRIFSQVGEWSGSGKGEKKAVVVLDAGHGEMRYRQK